MLKKLEHTNSKNAQNDSTYGQFMGSTKHTSLGWDYFLTN